MKDVYAALLLHSAGQPINEENVGKVLTAAGVTEEATKIKALVTALDGVNIDEVVKQAAVVAAPSVVEAKKEEKKDEKSEEDREAEASAGLASLFG
ncbi:MAG: 50S ribosomal protein P1 [Candidatus Micrarchaeota archaeon]